MFATKYIHIAVQCRRTRPETFSVSIIIEVYIVVNFPSNSNYFFIHINLINEMNKSVTVMLVTSLC